jgi:hypothetical protein
MSPYSYEALLDGHIRILTLLPGEFGEAICIQLSNVQLQEFSLAARAKSLDSAVGPSPARYEALSYAWGSKNRSHRLGSADGSYFQVTQSLHQALQYLRYPDRERRIWADAVCINQDDLTERASQVAVMANIFRNAICVLVWLGEATQGDTLAFAALHANDNWNPLGLEDEDIPADDELIQEALEKEPWCPCCRSPLSEADVDADRGYVAVEELCDREWFSRLWVYQEVACARAVEVHCGFHHRAWISFQNFYDPTYYSIKPSDIEVVSMCRIPTPGGFDPSVLLRLLVVLGEKDCREEQDRIFAIRSIAGLEHVKALEPDYTLPAHELCRRVGVECLRNGDFDYLHPGRFTTHKNQNATAGLPLPHVSLLLALASANSTEDEEHRLQQRPSWVPALHCLSEKDVAKYHEYSWHLGPAYLLAKKQPQGWDWSRKRKASAPGRLCVEFLAENPNVLRILGCRFGSVLDVLKHSGSPFAYGFSKHAYHNRPDPLMSAAFRAWMSRCGKFLSSYGFLVVKEIKELMYCNSLVTGFDADIYDLMMKDEPAPNRTEKVDSWLLREFLELHVEDDHKKLRYYDDFRNLAAIKSPDGRINLGWIPQSAGVGDLVSLFFGCPRPFLLRQQQDNGFTLLGDAWVFGVADDASFHIPQFNMEWFSLT